MVTTLIAYVVLVAFLVIEGRLRQDEQAKRLQAGASDQSSTCRVGLSFGACIVMLLVTPLLNLAGIGRIERAEVGWIGVAVALIGIGLRVWAAVVLGRFYTRTLLTSDDQQIVERGPYRLIRHPGYLGVLLLWIGTALATTNGIAIVVIVVLMSTAYSYRIGVEETMLASRFGQDYDAYRKHTWKLIPLLY